VKRKRSADEIAYNMYKPEEVWGRRLWIEEQVSAVVRRFKCQTFVANKRPAGYYTASE
jgi:hypothetical protein